MIMIIQLILSILYMWFEYLQFSRLEIGFDINLSSQFHSSQFHRWVTDLCIGGLCELVSVPNWQAPLSFAFLVSLLSNRRTLSKTWVSHIMTSQVYYSSLAKTSIISRCSTSSAAKEVLPPFPLNRTSHYGKFLWTYWTQATWTACSTYEILQLQCFIIALIPFKVQHMTFI